MRRRWFIRLEWKPQDLWIGVFWKSAFGPYESGQRRLRNGRWIRTGLDVWVCVLPMLPVHWGWHHA